ncbi:hypothetical protein HDU80_002893 [Chytriomyces hyalinus]|nr:hypothetical protein HDU80_002893 [Chytriomyces hyalinus]
MAMRHSQFGKWSEDSQLGGKQCRCGRFLGIGRQTSGLNHVLLSFLNTTLEEDLRSGAAELVGPCETMPPPFLVYPIGVEPTKPRRIGDARYLNSFTAAPKHHPETLRHLACWARSLLTVADVKACYYNFCLKESSWKYFGFSWDYKGKKCSFVSKSRQIKCCVFYDDFAIGELLASKGSPATRVLSATYVLLALGDDLGLSFGKKSQVVPSPEPIYLGFIVMLSQ